MLKKGIEDEVQVQINRKKKERKRRKKEKRKRKTCCHLFAFSTDENLFGNLWSRSCRRKIVFQLEV